MKKVIAAIAMSATLFTGTIAAAESESKEIDFTPNWKFSNVSLNKLDWSTGTQERAPHLKDFTFIELEGGAGYNWGDIYSFLDIEDFANYESREDVKLSGKIVANIYTPVENVNVYHQTFFVSTDGFRTTDHVLGVSYRTDVLDVKLTPFVGVQYSNLDASWHEGFSGKNGYMAGWTAMYDFQVGSENFSLTNWHEILFARNNEYLRLSNEVKELGHNGALALWWHPTIHLTTGVQYRYGDNKIGGNGNVNAAIYTVKYNF